MMDNSEVYDIVQQAVDMAFAGILDVSLYEGEADEMTAGAFDDAIRELSQDLSEL